VIESAAESNRDHLDHVATRALDMLSGLSDPVVGIWGLAFKAHTDDVRSSPAIELIERLHARQVEVRAHDPVARLLNSPVAQVGRLEAAAGADLLVVATEWPEYGSADLAETATAMRRPLIFDLRNIIDASAADRAGLTLKRLGSR
jgi:UDPglucose 6-dehydrogenase